MPITSARQLINRLNDVHISQFENTWLEIDFGFPTYPDTQMRALAIALSNAKLTTLVAHELAVVIHKHYAQLKSPVKYLSWVMSTHCPEFIAKSLSKLNHEDIATYLNESLGEIIYHAAFNLDLLKLLVNFYDKKELLDQLTQHQILINAARINNNDSVFDILFDLYSNTPQLQTVQKALLECTNDQVLIKASSTQILKKLLTLYPDEMRLKKMLNIKIFPDAPEYAPLIVSLSSPEKFEILLESLSPDDLNNALSFKVGNGKNIRERAETDVDCEKVVIKATTSNLKYQNTLFRTVQPQSEKPSTTDVHFLFG